MATPKNNNLSQKYQKKTDKEHILDNPDTYIGSIENVNSEQYIFEDNKIKLSEIDYNPGLFKLFDEGIVNCRDHVVRMQQQHKDNKDIIPVSQIKITINNDTITMYNNGNGIDIEKHPEYDIWIPELIFGHLRTSTNYNKSEKKIVGGKNGFGFKLVLIWSTFGSVETVDHIRGLKYYQEFQNNLDVILPPKIRKISGKTEPYTQITFKPDFKRLGLNGISSQMIQLFQRRVYDISGITSKDIKVKYNNELIKIKQFQTYMDLYLQNDSKKIYEEVNPRWSFGIALSDEFKQVSFVNGIYTSKGGKHVEYVVNQITKKMCAYILKKKKVEVKPSIIKEQLFIFVNSTIENPSFDSQTKDFLNTPVSKFGSTCEISDKVIDKLAKLGVMETSCALSDIKEQKKSKKTDGNKSKNIRGIPKLVDANFAGTAKSQQTMLILCEGDSAKAGIISGLSNDDRNYIGVYPMKGKILNVRGETMKKINDSKEISEIKQILGLVTGKTYTNTSSLRYGKVVFMTDQDLDGSHIKGLCINLIAHLWPSLLNISNFIGFMNTPILKATKFNKTINFYNNNDYEEWKQKNNDGKGFKIKYYKGLGTSTSKEFKEYFKQKKIVSFKLHDKDTDKIDIVFNKKKANERKEWLSTFDRTNVLNTNTNEVSYDEFINKELIHFSNYDNDRSIPSLVDGLKIAQRKILFSAFKKKLYNEIKVAQFSGYVSENSGYHHGEASLNGAIVNMAQDYLGSNNINLFMPNGQFGTRLQGGKDSASERYIFTRLNNISRKIFRKEDDEILKYLDDDGLMVEPVYYVPIIPMILVNGALGIGTGYSTNIPSYNPKEIIYSIKQKIKDHPDKLNYETTMVPYYKNFKGKVEQIEDYKYATSGVFKIQKNKFIIEELPIGVWTEDYIAFLDKCIDTKKNDLKDYKDLSTDKDIYIELSFNGNVDLNLYSDINKIIKNFKLQTTTSTSNMYLYNKDSVLKNYLNVNEIINDFIEVRLNYYDIRKQYLIEKMEHTLKIYSNKYKFITEILNDTLDLRKKKSDVVQQILKSKNYDEIDGNFNYLVKMPMDSVNQENVESLKNEYDKLIQEIEELKNTTIIEMYYNELTELDNML